MSRLIEGTWNCDYCNRKGIKGSIRICPSCAKMRGPNTKFHLPNEISYVPTQKAVTINRNPDWVCEFCEQLNSDDDSTCIACGAPRSIDTLNYFEYKQKSESVKTTSKTSDNPLEENKTEKNYDSEYISEAKKEISSSTDNSSNNSRTYSFSQFCHTLFSNSVVKISLASIGILLAIVSLIFILAPIEKELTVEELSWQRSINIERYQTVKESDWELPSNARLLYTKEEYHHTEQVIDHYTQETKEVSEEVIVDYKNDSIGTRDLGNGYFEEITTSTPIYETHWHTEIIEVPVYRNEAVNKTKYYYEIDKWLYERSVRTFGNNQSPYWGETNLKSDERESSKNETYSFIGIDENGKQQKVTLSYDEWITLKKGETLTFKISKFGNGQIMQKDLSSNT